MRIRPDAPVFVAKDFIPDSALADNDSEALGNALLYRHAREFATGHGVAAGWASPAENAIRTTAVYTEFIPSHEMPILLAASGNVGGATLDMKILAEAVSPEALVKQLMPMIDAYDSWLVATQEASFSSAIQADMQLRGAAKENIDRCRECARRIRDGITLIQQDRHVFAAFKFANNAMWQQRIHSLWAAGNRKLGVIEGTARDFDKPESRTWRIFQMGFILLTIRGIADEVSKDRQLVDLLWFPTGGGKTEAYLGLAAFTIALRRLRGDRRGMHAGAGVSIIMRYTLRLLTVQQFQRASALICAE